jgi:hypothetical protein
MFILLFQVCVRVVAMTSSTSRNEAGDHGTSIRKEDFALFS